MTDILAKVEKSSPMKDDYDTGHYNLALKDQLSLCFCQRFSLAARYVLIGLCDCHVKVDVILKHAALFFWRWRVKLLWVTTAARFNGHWVTWLWSLGSDRLCKCDVRSTTSALNWSSTQSVANKIVVIRQGNFVGYLEKILILRSSCGIFPTNNVDENEMLVKILKDSSKFFIK